ncbi:prevent-host-death family protein [Thiovulum sp. ES]|nr:prevent-host-death family protein [Thiovulum sp. ES]
MQSVFYSEARNNLRGIINSVVDDCEEYLITTKNKKQAIVISYEEYNSLKETLYLLSSKNNRDRLLESVEEIENGSFKERELLD